MGWPGSILLQNTHLSWSNQFLNYKIKFGPTFFIIFCPWTSCCIINHITSHHGSKMGQEQTTRLNQWIFVFWSADINFFFLLLNWTQWRCGSYTSTQKPFYESEAKQPQLILYVSVGWIHIMWWLFSVRTSECAFHTPTVCYTNQIWPTHTHTHLPLSAKCSCLPSFPMQGLMKVKTVSEESE